MSETEDTAPIQLSDGQREVMQAFLKRVPYSPRHDFIKEVAGHLFSQSNDRELSAACTNALRKFTGPTYEKLT
jgi:hypothetical protein